MIKGRGLNPPPSLLDRSAFGTTEKGPWGPEDADRSRDPLPFPGSANVAQSLIILYTGNRELQLGDAEHERALRYEAERKLHDMTVESRNTHSRLLNLQREFKNMEEMVTNMMQYKTKIDQLKQEKSSLSVTYESNLSKYRSHIGNLERENMMLMSDIRRYENQMDGKTDDRSKLLLERLKILEAENSSLVLENEQQRQQYEKCLDEIANQVVQALLAQKTLREECVKLQKRVTDLESQNSELSLAYNDKLRDAGIIGNSSIPNASVFDSTSREVPNEAVITSTTQCQVSAAISFTQSMQLSPMSQYILQNTVAQKCLQQLQPESMETLHDMRNDSPYVGHSGQPHLTIQSAWGDDQHWQRSRSASSPSKISPRQPSNQCNQKTKIETEFPATPSSPKVKHISVIDRAKAQRSASTSSLPVHSKLPGTKTHVSKSQVSQTSRSVSNVAGNRHVARRNSEPKSVKCKSQPDHIDKVNVSNKVTSRAVKVQNPLTTDNERVKNIPVKRSSKSQQSIPQSCTSVTHSKIPMKSVLKSEHNSQNLHGESPVSMSRAIITENVPKSQTHVVHHQGKSIAVAAQTNFNNSVTKSSLVRSSAQGTVHNTMSAPKVHDTSSNPILPKAQYFYDYSDEDSDFNRPISGEFRASSAASLNEILDGDDTDTLLDEEITAETFSFFDPPSFVKSSNAKDKTANEADSDKHKHKKVFKSSSLGSKPDIVKDTMNSEMKMHSRSPHMGRRKLSLSYQSKKVKSQGQRPSSLILTREKQNMYDCSSSLSSTDSDENWSPQMERKAHPRHKANRKSSSSSNRSSYHSSVSDKLSHRSSQELTPVAIDSKQFVPSVSSEVQLSKNTEALRHSGENITEMKDSTDSMGSNSLNRKKGPPPPVPRKPLSGKKSPGIRMGIQSPGFRQNKQSQYSCVGKDAIADPSLILKPHEFKSEATNVSKEPLQKCHISTAEIKINSSASKRNVCDEVTNKTISISTNHKYVSSDSSFEGKNLDKVERSGSKDDGYSTMSSDIQPEALERFSDASLTKTEALFTDSSRNEFSSTPVSPKIMHQKISYKNSPETVSSDLDSILEATTPDVDMKTSSSLSSLTCLKSQNSPKSNPSEERAVKFGSLGRVKAMKMLFEAESLNSSDTKPSKFPLRKSPSVDSSLSCKRNNHDVHKRHSLGDDFKLSPVPLREETDSKSVEVSAKIENLLEPKEMQKQKATDERKKFEPQQRPTLKPSIPEKPPSFQPLHLSEENFLSDIPEERDEGDMSAHSSANHLEVSLRNSQQMSRRLEVLNLLRIQHKKVFWCSLQGLSRISLAAGKVQDSKTTIGREFRPVDNLKRPLERSRSLDDLSRDVNSQRKHKLLPRLQRRHGIPVIDDLVVEERVQCIIRSHILQQLSSINVSEEDLQHLTFSQLLENEKLKDLKCSRIPRGPPSHISNFHGKDFAGQSLDIFSSWEEKSIRRMRQSSMSSSESSINQDLDARFRSDYYSLCTVESSKASSVDGDADHSDQIQHTCRDDKNNCSRCIQEKNTEEFEEISRQLANLSKTVTALHQSLSSLNSHDSETESNEDRSHDFAAPSSDFKDNDGYQWEEDEFYLTPCGGEIIMGNSPFSPTGACADWVNEYVDDTSCNDEFEFYGNLPTESENGMYDFKKLCDSITDGDFQNMSSSGTGEATADIQTDDVNGNKMQIGDGEDRQKGRNTDVLDPKMRAAMLDAMVHLSGASMDSLDDNIGVDHVMCSRLIGRGENVKGPIRSAVPRPTVDLSKFYSRYGESEQEAVAAFDFLNDISTSPDTSQQDIPPQMDQSQASLQNTQGKPKTESKMKSDRPKVIITKEKAANQSKERLINQARDSSFSHSKDKSVNKNKENTNNVKEKAPNQSKEKVTQLKKPWCSQETVKSVGQSLDNDNQSKLPELKKQSQGLDNSDTSKKGSQGLVSSISRFVYGNKAATNTTNVKTPKLKPKAKKTTLSKLPRKLIPGKEKASKSKLESKIPKPSKN
ncbi:hypothetical protein FSP39_004607 [Pinctada imbricata]|uniref:Nck-associated protein 5 n=1 Tax=Pinctada imbricata TaxID=66713 RepID=A0AA88XH96_PINIB|nr:hypothetical protein FSP39_004607 [Pinctada imbricata]